MTMPTDNRATAERIADELCPAADAVARLTAQMLDPWERVRCLPRCRSDEPMNHGECDCGSQQFVSDLRTLLAAYADAARDRERMREVMTQAARSLNDLSDTDGAYLGAWAGLMNTLSHRLTDAARTGEAR